MRTILEQITLRNFKSFRNATFDLEPFSVIYGANGAGKSNFNDALRFLRAIGRGQSIRDAIEGHFVSNYGTAQGDITEGVRGGAANITNFSTRSKIFSINLLATIEGIRYRYHISVDAQEYRIAAEWLLASNHPGNYVYDTHPDIETWEDIEPIDGPIVHAHVFKNSPGRNPRRVFSSGESILSQFDGRKAEFVYNEEPAALLRAELESIQPLELRPEVLRNYSPLGRSDIGEHGEYFASGVWALIRAASGHALDNIESQDARMRLGAIQSWLNELSPRAVKSISTIAAPTGEVIFAVNEAPHSRRQVSARSLSDGTLRFAALAFALLGTPDRHTYVVEEIENGISTARLGLMLQMFSTATREDRSKQVIATTHSPTILDLAEPKLVKGMLFIYWDESEKSSKVKPVSALTPDEIGDEQSLGDLLTNGYFQMAADAE
ncbi:ABC-type transport system involved in cytochrome c biogenesis ATPase subunit [Allocatelliglobosispora scoriae]|uniref:ABC-type transport system involved in cytochrome c biogenesis ATPase subunit n=1 Tax=Allocatelliglobosispora scoriae TaxID=643052 RepID=A0A841BSA6_9ACTN|nr:ATP-binding protein [Allocatelliglobosispora scoriae]MBB5869680.1 ABC-type transport system involved in cytochrome c biogenesis ATPase subunit [Allocatelliglobosispora scoriae]